jgi:hypothetical protein
MNILSKHVTRRRAQYDSGILIRKDWNGLSGRGAVLTPVQTDSIEDAFASSNRVEGGIR